MSNEIVFPKKSQAEFDEIQNPLELDLTALFHVLQDMVYGILDKNIDPEQMIKEIEEIFQ